MTRIAAAAARGHSRPPAGHSYKTYGAWPTADQELLLRAALLEGERARAAFEAWRSRTDFDRLDGASVRLLPLLHQNLVDQGIDAGAPLSGRLRGIYRQTWYRNQLLISALRELLERFAQAGVRTLVLKGVPLALCYYPTPAMRPMTDVDVLVPADRALEVLDIALEAGLIPNQPDEDWPPRLTASKSFRDVQGREFDLHAYVMHDCREAGADDEFWASAVPLAAGGLRTLTLAPEDHVLHTLAHAAWRNPLSPARWVADVAMIIRRQRGAFDWGRLSEQARNRRLSLLVGQALRYLNDRTGIEIPRDALSGFETARIGAAERFESGARLIPGAAGVAATHVARYLRARGLDRDWRGLFGFVRYLRDTWRLESSWQLPAATCEKTFNRLRTWRGFSRSS